MGFYAAAASHSYCAVASYFTPTADVHEIITDGSDKAVLQSEKRTEMRRPTCQDPIAKVDGLSALGEEPPVVTDESSASSASGSLVTPAVKSPIKNKKNCYFSPKLRA